MIDAGLASAAAKAQAEPHAMPLAEIKVVVVGDSGAGKTSLSSAFCHDAMPSSSAPTIGASFLQKRVACTRTSASSAAEEEVMLQIWDTAGQERFRSMAPMYYRGAKAAIVVFDASKADAFESCESWRRDLLQYADANVAIAYAANKTDLPEAAAACEAHADAWRAAAAANGIPLLVTSAVSGAAVGALFGSVSQRAANAAFAQRDAAQGISGISVRGEARPVQRGAPGSCC